MRLSVYAQFTLKDKPKGMGGITGEQWTFGKTEPVEFHYMARAFIEKLLFFYTIWVEPDTLESQKQTLIEWLQSIKFVKPEEE